MTDCLLKDIGVRCLKPTGRVWPAGRNGRVYCGRAKTLIAPPRRWREKYIFFKNSFCALNQDVLFPDSMDFVEHMAFKIKDKLVMVKPRCARRCGDTSDQPGMNHAVGWSPRPTCERLCWDLSTPGHPLWMKCRPLKCFLLTTRWELQGTAPHPISANKPTLGQMNYYVHLTLVFMTISPEAAAPCYPVWLTLSPEYLPSVCGQETQPCLFLSGCHTANWVELFLTVDTAHSGSLWNETSMSFDEGLHCV